ncbi:hypothetical protein BH11PSE11_BH11PSE11_27720 [soil metagenome]
MKKYALYLSMLSLLIPMKVFAVGAIAVDDAVGDMDAGYGLVTGEDSEGAAKAAAMKECKKAGNDNCRVVVWFKSCGAYAASKKYYGWGYGADKATASDMALDKCGNSSCKIIVAECE